MASKRNKKIAIDMLNAIPYKRIAEDHDISIGRVHAISSDIFSIIRNNNQKMNCPLYKMRENKEFWINEINKL